MVQTIVHVDSLNGKQKGGVFDYYNCEIPLANNYRNVTKISLKCLELPCAFDNVRAPFNTIKINRTNVIYEIVIPPGNYTTIDSLIDVVNQKLEEIFSALSFVFLRVGDYISVLSTRTVNDWYIMDTLMSKHIFGIRENNLPVILSNNTYTKLTTQLKWNMSLDNYIQLFCQEIGVMSNNSLSTFKICLPVNNGDILYLNENLFFKNEINCNLPNCSSLSFLFYDRFNTPLLSSGYSWSGSLELTHD